MTNTDSKNKIIDTFAQAFPFPLAVSDQLTELLGRVNYQGGYTTKSAGAMFVVTDSNDAGYALLMSVGDTPEAVWKDLGGTHDLTPTGTAAVGKAFTDTKPKLHPDGPLVGSTALPIISLASLMDANHPINNYHLGGKAAHSYVIVETVAGTTFKLVGATGSTPESDWTAIDGTVYTPTGFIETTGPFDKKPKVEQIYVSAVPFPIVSLEDLADGGNQLNAGDHAVSGKDTGAMVSVITEEGVVSPRVATGSDPLDPWVTLTSGADEDTTPVARTNEANWTASATWG
jgi:hypothetical protein